MKLRALVSSTILLCVSLLCCIGCATNKDQAGKTTIKLVHFYVDQKDIWKNNVVEDFQKQHPEINVEVEAIPFGLYTTKIQSAAAAGTKLADVVLIDDWFGQELFKQNYTIPLDTLFDRDFKKEDFFGEFLTVWKKGNQPSGQLMAMPACGGVAVLFYNKDMFDAAHLSYPDSTWSYDDLRNAAIKLTSNDPNPATKKWGLLVDDGRVTGIDTYIYSNGGAILNSDYTKGALLEPASVAAVQSYADLVLKDHVAPPPDPSQGLSQRFQQGRYAMMVTFDGSKEQLRSTNFKWDMALPPHGKAGIVDRQNGQAFGITRTSEHPKESWELIKYIVTLPNKSHINELYYTLMPLYKPLAYSKEFLDGEPKCNRQALLSIGNAHVFTMITPGWQEWRDHGFIPNMQDILSGRVSVEAGLKAANDKINEVLSRTAAR